MHRAMKCTNDARKTDEEEEESACGSLERKKGLKLSEIKKNFIQVQ